MILLSIKCHKLHLEDKNTKNFRVFIFTSVGELRMREPHHSESINKETTDG